MHRMLLLLACLFLLGCPKGEEPAKDPPPEPEVTETPPRPAAALRADIGPRYRAQVARLLAIEWRKTGSLAYPDAVEPLLSGLVWNPPEGLCRVPVTIQPGQIGSLTEEQLGYLPPDDQGAPPQFWFYAYLPQDASKALSNEPIDGADILGMNSGAATPPVALADLIADKTTTSEQLVLAMLQNEAVPEAALAASAHYALRALLEWVVNERGGVWPETEADLLGATLRPPGLVQHITVVWAPEEQSMFTLIDLPDVDPVLIVTQVVQAEGDGRWISVNSRPAPGTSLPTSGWRVL